MKTINKEEYKEIPIEALKISNRVYNILKRNKINTLYDVIENLDKLHSLKGLGLKCASEIEVTAKEFAEKESAAKQTDVASQQPPSPSLLSEKILNRPVSDLKGSVRVRNALQRGGFKTIGKVLAADAASFESVPNLGPKSLKALHKELESLRTLGEEYFDKEEVQEYKPSLLNNNGWKFDVKTAVLLHDEYGLRTELLAEWYGITYQSAARKLNETTNHGKWRGKRLEKNELAMITYMVNFKIYYRETQKQIYCLLNNQLNDCVFLVVSENDVKCFFLADLPEDLQEKIKKAGLDKYTEEEIGKIDSLGEFIYIKEKQYFLPFDRDEFRHLARKRHMNSSQYSLFLFDTPLWLKAKP